MCFDTKTTKTLFTFTHSCHIYKILLKADISFNFKKKFTIIEVANKIQRTIGPTVLSYGPGSLRRIMLERYKF